MRTELHPPIRSLAFATDIDALDDQSTVRERDGYIVVASPHNPRFHWGNFLIHREVPIAGDRERWEARFAAEFPDTPSRHLLHAWDTTTAELGAAAAEFESAGYEIEHVSALVATPDELRAHARASTAAIRRLDPTVGGPDEAAWQQVLALQLGNREAGHTIGDYRAYLDATTAARRAMYSAGRAGGWYVAELDDGTIVACCGIVVTEGRGRYQAVDTHVEHRRAGHASRLVHEVGRRAVDEFGATRLVIVAEVDYHAKALYESLGFVEREQSLAACWWPTSLTAHLHPERGSAG